MKAVILSFISPVLGSFMGVLAKTVKISAKPPLLNRKYKTYMKTAALKALPVSNVVLPSYGDSLFYDESTPDPDLAAIQSVELSAGGDESGGLDGGGVGAAGGFSQAECSNVLTCMETRSEKKFIKIKRRCRSSF